MGCDVMDVKGNLNLSDAISLGTPLSKSYGGAGGSAFPFVSSHSGTASSQVISSSTLADVTNSSANVSFPDNVSQMVMVINLQAQNSVADAIRITYNIDSGAFVQDVGQFNAGATGLLCSYNGSGIADISAHAGSTVSVKLQAARIFNNFTLQAFNWILLAF